MIPPSNCFKINPAWENALFELVIWENKNDGRLDALWWRLKEPHGTLGDLDRENEPGGWVRIKERFPRREDFDASGNMVNIPPLLDL